MQQHILKRKLSLQGMALFTVLSVMVILLIISLAIVSLSTGNLKTVGNINARFQALNLANAAAMYAIYELQNNWSNHTPWSPGHMLPPPSGLTYATHTYNPLTNTNGLPGKCRLAYIDNLINPHTAIVVGGPSFYPSLNTEVFSETAVIVAQGEYGGFKRTIRITVKYTYFGTGIEGVISYNSGTLLLNGIENINTLAPGNGTIFSEDGITYNNLSNYKFYNGSVLRSKGAITRIGGSVAVDSRFIESNKPAGPGLIDWSLEDPNVTGGDPAGYAVNYTGLTEPTGLGADSIARPSFHHTPNIEDNIQYVHKGHLIINQDTFVNGSLHIQSDTSFDGILTIQQNASLFVNGILTIDDNLDNKSTGNLYVAGYIDDPNGNPDNYGLSLKINKLTNKSIDTKNKKGLAIFTDGDIRISGINYSWIWTQEINNFFLHMPLDPEKIISTFNMLGLSEVDAPEARLWYESGSGAPPLVNISGFTGRQILEGYANDKLTEMGLTPIPPEISKWFSHPYSKYAVDWATFDGNIKIWETFKRNPTLYTNANDTFLQAVIFTHGTLTLDAYDTGGILFI